jgi:hypothetical protein
MISGIHAIIYSKQAERLRALLRDSLHLPSVDAGGGWLIFALPPAELAVHPAEDSYHELYLMCDDIQATTEQLKTKGVQLAMPIADQGWGLLTRLRLSSGDEIGLYQPKHPTATALKESKKPSSVPKSAPRKVLARKGSVKKRRSHGN